MTTRREGGPRSVELCISFYTPAQFRRAKELRLPGVNEFVSYEKWLKENRRLVEGLLNAGRKVTEIVVDSDECLRW